MHLLFKVLQDLPVVDATMREECVWLKIVMIAIEKQSIEEFREAYMFNQLEKVNRMDIVWDVYFPDSLKGTTREKRDKDIKKSVSIYCHAKQLQWVPPCRPEQN